MIKEFQDSDNKIIELEDALENLKAKKLSKKELQGQRNKLTAQLSRDRIKLELIFLKTICLNYQRLLRKYDREITS